MRRSSLLPLLLTPFLSACGEDPSPPPAKIAVPAALQWKAPAPLETEGKVVLYCSLDDVYSRPLVKEFEQRTGIAVTFVPDNEVNKTVGTVNRLIAEKDAPQCDVYWNNEVAQTIRLKNQGILVPFGGASADSIPAQWKDAAGFWCGFAARARVYIISRKQMTAEGIAEEDWPRTFADLADPRFKGLGCIARPLTGTTATHGTALFSLLGEAAARELFQRIEANEIAPMESNGATMKAVREHRFPFGLTDTDDYHVALLEKGPEEVASVYVDGDPEGAGALLIPNTVCKIKGGPHPEAADVLIDFILSKEIEYRLARAASRQIPVRAGIAGPEGIGWSTRIKVRTVDWEQVARDLDNSAYQEFMKDLFRR